MSENKYTAAKDLVSLRAAVAILKMKNDDARYQEVCKYQDEN